MEFGKLYLLKVYGAKLAMAADPKTISFSIKGLVFEMRNGAGIAGKNPINWLC